MVKNYNIVQGDQEYDQKMKNMKNTFQRLLRVVNKKIHTQFGPHKFITNSLLLLPKKQKTKKVKQIKNDKQQ